MNSQTKETLNEIISQVQTARLHVKDKNYEEAAKVYGQIKHSMDTIISQENGILAKQRASKVFTPILQEIENFLELKREQQPEEEKSTISKASGLSNYLNEKETNDKIESAFFLVYDFTGKGPEEEIIQYIESEIITPDTINTRFDDIIGFEDIKNSMKQYIIFPTRFPKLFEGLRDKPQKILLLGPDRLEKAQLIKATAAELKATLIPFSFSTMISKWSDNLYIFFKILFRMAKFYGPSIIFFNDLENFHLNSDDTLVRDGLISLGTEALTINRIEFKKMISQYHTMEEGKKVFLFGTAEKPWNIELSLRRIFEKRIFFAFPNNQEREELIRKELKDFDCNDISYAVQHTKHYSRSEIVDICKEAAMESRRRRFLELGEQNNNNKEVIITSKDFIRALRVIRKSFSENDMTDYNNWKAI